MAMERDDLTEEELLRATARFRDKSVADMVALAIGLAAETHPDIMREALGKVFDVTALEDMAKRAMLIVTQAKEKANETAVEVRILAEQVAKDVERLSNDFDEIRLNIDKMRRWAMSQKKPPVGQDAKQAARVP